MYASVRACVRAYMRDEMLPRLTECVTFVIQGVSVAEAIRPWISVLTGVIRYWNK